MVKWVRGVLLVIGGIVVGGWLWSWLAPEQAAPPAPLAPMVEEERRAPVRVASGADLVRWALAEEPVVVVDTANDALPNGMATSMAPLLVDWERSRLADDQPWVEVRNVAVGGNPVRGRNVLATVRVPLTGFAGVEWCLTPSRNARGEDTVMGHAMIRFLWGGDRRPEVVGVDGAGASFPLAFEDLMLSWEAWRPPRTRYDAVAGLVPDNYGLTVRAYSGAQRFLTDALRGNPWVCYPLNLPDVADAERTLLLVGLAMGDSLFRRTIDDMARMGQIDPASIARVVDLDAEDRERVRAVLARYEVPDDPMMTVFDQAELSYDLLQRSCVTQSLMAVQWALRRLHERHELGPPPELAITPEPSPPWVRQLADAGTMELVGYLPGAIWYVARNGTVLPANAWKILDQAGLLRYQGGEPVRYYFHRDTDTPYGTLRDNMM